MDITMCQYNKCELKDKCLRFNDETNSLSQSYLYNLKEDCADKNHNLFVSRLGEKG